MLVFSFFCIHICKYCEEKQAFSVYIAMHRKKVNPLQSSMSDLDIRDSMKENSFNFFHHNEVFSRTNIK